MATVLENLCNLWLPNMHSLLLLCVYETRELSLLLCDDLEGWDEVELGEAQERDETQVVQNRRRGWM